MPAWILKTNRKRAQVLARLVALLAAEHREFSAGNLMVSSVDSGAHLLGFGWGVLLFGCFRAARLARERGGWLLRGVRGGGGGRHHRWGAGRSLGRR